VLHYAQLPNLIWGEALHFIVWVKNRVIRQALGKITPYKQLYGTKPNLSKVIEWGQKVWVHQGSVSKLDGWVVEVRWVEFDNNSTHAHHVYWQGKNCISFECDICFVSRTVTVHIPPSLPIPNDIHITAPPALPTLQLSTPPVSTAAKLQA
jgi:hypothetical protein